MTFHEVTNQLFWILRQPSWIPRLQSHSWQWQHRKIYEFVLRNILNQNKHTKVNDYLPLSNAGKNWKIKHWKKTENSQNTLRSRREFYERLNILTIIFLKCSKNLFKIALKLPCSSRFGRNYLRVTSLKGKINWMHFAFPGKQVLMWLKFYICEDFLSLFCVYVFKEISLMSNLICRPLSLISLWSLVRIFKFFFEQFFFSYLVYLNRKVETDYDYSRLSLCFFFFNLGCSSAPHIGLFWQIPSLLSNNWGDLHKT